MRMIFSAIVACVLSSCGSESSNQQKSHHEVSAHGGNANARTPVLKQIEELHLYTALGTDQERQVPIAALNDECQQVTPENFKDIWQDFDEFETTCLQPDYVLTNNTKNVSVNTLVVRAFKRGRTAEVDIKNLVPADDLSVKLFNFYDGSDYADDMNDAYWTFITSEWRRYGDWWAIQFTPKTDRFNVKEILYDPTAYFLACVTSTDTCSTIMVLGVNPSIEGAWEVTSGPENYAASEVRQFDQVVTWKFVGGNIAQGTLESGELKVQFEAGGGPAGVRGSGSFRVAQLVAPNEMAAFYQHTTPGEGQTTGDIAFRRVPPQ